MTAFKEKAEKQAAFINGGFFVVNNQIGDYLTDDTCVFEQEPLQPAGRRAANRRLSAHRLLAVHGHLSRTAAARPGCGTAARRRGKSGDVLNSIRTSASSSPATPASKAGGFRFGSSSSARASSASACRRPRIPICTNSSGAHACEREIICDIRDVEALQAAVADSSAGRDFASGRAGDCPPHLRRAAGDARHQRRRHRPFPGSRAPARPGLPVLIVTTDKCYENREWEFAYRETDPLGGHDVYSISKAATELVAQSWRRSFFAPEPEARPGGDRPRRQRHRRRRLRGGPHRAGLRACAAGGRP